MQIYNADLDIDLLEFCDRFGNIRSTAVKSQKRCSAVLGVSPMSDCIKKSKVKSRDDLRSQYAGTDERKIKN
jgi:hypothetical protein